MLFYQIPTKVYNNVTGIGWASLLVSAMVSVYYNVIVMYALLYISLSLLNIGWQVPWASCNNEWNTKFCRTKPLPDLDSIVAVPERITASLGEYFLGPFFLYAIFNTCRI